MNGNVAGKTLGFRELGKLNYCMYARSSFFFFFSITRRFQTPFFAYVNVTMKIFYCVLVMLLTQCSNGGEGDWAGCHDRWRGGGSLIERC
jgi:hypothetical protein